MAPAVWLPGYNLRLVGEDGNEVDVGEIGELLVAGDQPLTAIEPARQPRTLKVSDAHW